MIIVEGFDASGKTTLANEIGRAMGWQVLHTGGPTRDEDDVYACLFRSCQRMRMKCVQDRITHISESVYSLLHKPTKAAIAIDALGDIRAPTMVIYCRPPDEVLLKGVLEDHRREAHDTDEHMARVLETAPALIRAYDTIMEIVALRNKIVRYDRTVQGDMQRVVEMATRWFQ